MSHPSDVLNNCPRYLKQGTGEGTGKPAEYDQLQPSQVYKDHNGNPLCMLAFTKGDENCVATMCSQMSAGKAQAGLGTPPVAIALSCIDNGAKPSGFHQSTYDSRFACDNPTIANSGMQTAKPALMTAGPGSGMFVNSAFPSRNAGGEHTRLFQ